MRLAFFLLAGHVAAVAAIAPGKIIDPLKSWRDSSILHHTEIKKVTELNKAALDALESVNTFLKNIKGQSDGVVGQLKPGEPVFSMPDAWNVIEHYGAFVTAQDRLFESLSNKEELFHNELDLTYKTWESLEEEKTRAFAFGGSVKPLIPITDDGEGESYDEVFDNQTELIVESVDAAIENYKPRDPEEI